MASSVCAGTGEDSGEWRAASGMVPRSGGYPPSSVSDRLGKRWGGKRHADKLGPAIEGDEGGMIGDGTLAPSGPNSGVLGFDEADVRSGKDAALCKP
eukprot:scaffold8225_cov129-Isochrysis_galbana.AAC.7